MGKEDVYNQLKKQMDTHLEEINKLDELDKSKKLDKLWEESLTKGDLISVIGISVSSVTNSLRKLILQGEVIEIKQQIDEHKKNKVDRRRSKYVIKNEYINDLVDDGDD